MRREKNYHFFIYIQKYILMPGKTDGRRRGRQRLDMVALHHQLNGYESGQSLGDSKGLGSQSIGLQSQTWLNNRITRNTLFKNERKLKFELWKDRTVYSRYSPEENCWWNFSKSTRMFNSIAVIIIILRRKSPKIIYGLLPPTVRKQSNTTAQGTSRSSWRHGIKDV